MFSSSTPALGFCPSCRAPAPAGTPCPVCGAPCDAPPRDYVERLLQTVLSAETNRAGMAVDVLTKWLREPRAVVPLTLLIESDRDPYPLVLGARGLGWLRDRRAVPALSRLLEDDRKPFVARIAAAEALGQIGGEAAIQALKRASRDPLGSVARAAARALQAIQETR